MIISSSSIAYCFTSTMFYNFTGCSITGGGTSTLIFLGLPRPRLGAATTPEAFSSIFTAYCLIPLNLSIRFFLPLFLGSACTLK